MKIISQFVRCLVGRLICSSHNNLSWVYHEAQKNVYIRPAMTAFLTVFV